MEEKILKKIEEVVNCYFGMKTLYKYYHNTKEIKEDDTLSSLKTIKSGDLILGMSSKDLYFTFCRFKGNEEFYYGSSFYNYYQDCLLLTPQKSIQLIGFSVTAPKYTDVF